MTGPSHLGFEELGPLELNEHDDALEAIRALEAVADDAPVRTGPAFSDRVMAALADEPAPSAVGFLFPLRRHGLFRGFAESLRQAWAFAGSGRPSFARAAALAYVLVVAIAGTSVVGAASFGAAGALGLLEAPRTAVPTPSPTLAPSEKPESTESAEPSEDAEPSDSAEPEVSDDHGGGGAPEASDDHGGSSGSGGGGEDGSSGSGGSGGSDGGAGAHETDDHSGSEESSSGDGSGSIEIATPRPTGTPKPSETPH